MSTSQDFAGGNIIAGRWATFRSKKLTFRIGSGLALFFAIACVFAIVTRFDVIYVNHKVDFGRTSVGPAGTHSYLLRREPIYRSFLEIAPFTSNTMSLEIGGTRHLCSASTDEVSDLGDGRCSYLNGYIWFSTPGNVTLGADQRIYREHFPIRVAEDLIWITAGFSVFFIVAAVYGGTPKRWLLLAGGGLLTVGTVLIAFNLVGLTLSLRDPRIAEYGRKNSDVTLNYSEAVKQLTKSPTETNESYAARAARVIQQSTLQDYLAYDFNELHVYVPIWENWLLHFAGLRKASLREYVFSDGPKALERGVGLCGEVSSMLAWYLEENGIKTKIIGLNGHVVVEAEVNPGTWRVFDAFNGLAIPADLKTLEQNPELVRSYYSPAVAAEGYDPNGFGKFLVGLYVKFYTSSDDNTSTPWDSNSRAAKKEARAYRLKWIIPLGILLIGGAMTIIGIFANRRHSR